MRDPQILAFMDRVSYEVHPDFFVPGSRAATTSLGAIEIQTSRGTFSDAADYPLGTPREGYYLSDDGLVEKFRGNAERLLTPSAIDRAVRLILELDQVGDVNELTRELTQATAV
jgi:2-methylcitrate dehydratase PrpD